MVQRGANEVASVVRTRRAGFLCLMQRAENVGSENVYFIRVLHLSLHIGSHGTRTENTPDTSCHPLSRCPRNPCRDNE